MNGLRTEDDLRAALDELSLDAPAAADVLPRNLSGVALSRRRIRRWAPVAAAALVVALAVGLALGLSRGGNSAPSAVGRASDLVGVQWQVASVGGARATQGFGLEIEPNGRFGQNIGSCSSLQGQLSITGTYLKIHNVRLSLGLCPIVPKATPLEEQETAALKSMLTGTVSWSIPDGQLTLRKDGVPTIVYARSRQSPASTRQWTFRGVGISVPSDWPLNAEHCGTPVRDTVIFPHAVLDCLVARPPGVTSVEFSAYDPKYDPFPTPPRGEPGTFLIDGVEATERSTEPSQSLQIVEVQVRSRNVTVTIASPSRTEAFNLESQIYIVSP
jgi:hypothetical protein